MNGGVFKLEELFSGKIFVIPDYQRGYAWEEQQWEDFLSDLEFLGESKNHYTGNVVLHQQTATVRDQEGKSNAVFNVVDGQQRLTTVVILLQVIYEQILPGNAILSSGIRKAYIQFKDLNGQSAFKLRLNSDCQDYFARNILANPASPQGPTIASHLRLKEAKAYFAVWMGKRKAELKEKFNPWLLSLYDKIVSRLIVTQYTVEKSSEVGVIFEVMNNRGKQISELEKVKNYLLYLSSKLTLSDEHSIAEEINATWTAIFERLMAAGLNRNEDEDRLLRAHWLTAFDANARDWRGSASIKDKFNLKIFDHRHADLLRELHQYINSLKNVIVPFCEAFRPSYPDSFASILQTLRPAARHSAEKLRRLNVIAPLVPILIACRVRFPSDGDKYIQLLKLSEVFALRVYKFESKRSDAGQALLFQLGNNLYRGVQTFEEVLTAYRHLALRLCSNKAFKEHLELDPESPWYGWDALKYVLYEYEEHLAARNGTKVSWDVFDTKDPQRTIEHILPQTPTLRYWKERFEAKDRKEYTHDIGNLCLTEDNSSYQNRAFPDKKGHPGEGRCYANSNLFQERELAKFEDWNSEAFKARRNKIVHWIASRWHLDDSDFDQAVELDVIEPNYEQAYE